MGRRMGKKMRIQLWTVVVGLVSVTSAWAQDTAEETPYYGIPQVREINKDIRQYWADWSISPSPVVDDSKWCRRVFLDIVGRVPTVRELQAFINSDDEAKKAKLVDQLLHDEKYTEEYARNWTTIWTNILIGRRGGTERNTLTSREGLQKYLRDTFARNKPYNQMVYELITAKGSTKPGTENFNGATNFLVMKVNEEKGTLATSETSKTFLGLQVQCTQCHNHPFNEWKQQKFWEFNAFFRQTRALRRYVEGTREIDHAELINEDYEGEGGDPADAELYYELRNGLLQVAYPVFVDGQEIDHSGYVEDVERRTELGKFVVQSPFLDKMAVNRLWAHFMGHGFTKPVDDLGPHNAPSRPALLEYLGQEFRKNSHNLKELIKWITLSEPYSLSSEYTADNKMDDPSLGEPPKFSHFYLRQMQAEQLYHSLITATHADKTQGSYEEQERRKTEWLKQFVIAFGTDEGGEQTTFNGTIPQALMMFNGDLIKNATETKQGAFLQIIADSKMKPPAKINYLFQAGLARDATRDEINIANKLLIARKRDTKEALKDIWWAVLNSNEFIMIH